MPISASCSARARPHSNASGSAGSASNPKRSANAAVSAAWITGGKQTPEDLERIRDRHTADLLSAMEPELREKGREYASLLRDELIPADRRSEFDRLAAECVVDL